MTSSRDLIILERRFVNALAATSDEAITAAAHKLARLIYVMLTKGEQYTDQGQQYYEERYRQRVISQLQRRAQSLGMALVPTA